MELALDRLTRDVRGCAQSKGRTCRKNKTVLR